MSERYISDLIVEIDEMETRIIEDGAYERRESLSNAEIIAETYYEYHGCYEEALA